MTIIAAVIVRPFLNKSSLNDEYEWAKKIYFYGVNLIKTGEKKSEKFCDYV
jgi:hypothetical protein